MNAQKDSVWYQLYMAQHRAQKANTAAAQATPRLEELEIRLGWRHLKSVDRSQPGGGTLLDRISDNIETAGDKYQELFRWPVQQGQD